MERRSVGFCLGRPDKRAGDRDVDKKNVFECEKFTSWMDSVSVTRKITDTVPGIPDRIGLGVCVGPLS